MKYKDRNTLLIQSKHQKESNDYGFPLESNREVKRRRKKELKEFWSKSLRGHLSEDFWNLLDMNEQSSVSYDLKNYEGSKEAFVKELKIKFFDRLSDCRELTLKKLGID